MPWPRCERHPCLAGLSEALAVDLRATTPSLSTRPPALRAQHFGFHAAGKGLCIATRGNCPPDEQPILFRGGSNVPLPRQRIPVGLLYSGTGFYGVVGREMLHGAMLGIEEVNAWTDTRFVLDPVVADPGEFHDSLRTPERFTDRCREERLPLRPLDRARRPVSRILGMPVHGLAQVDERSRVPAVRRELQQRLVGRQTLDEVVRPRGE